MPRRAGKTNDPTGGNERNRKDPTAVAEALLDEADRLRRACKRLKFSEPVACVYNPLEYARAGYEAYVRRFARAPLRAIFLGMNPGPYGMVQTGVPFGEIVAVRDWMGLELAGKIRRPKIEHPKRPVQGFDCTRSEVSGRRLWGLFADRCGSAEAFFAEHFVANYCPLVFMKASGENLTPDKLPAAESEPLFAACDRHLTRLIEILQPEFAIGIGKFAEERLRRALETMPIGSGAGESANSAGPPKLAGMLHPSPASPAANRDFTGTALRQMRACGLWE